MLHARMPVGFMTLREFVVQRPTLRVDALNILLELTTHPGMQLSQSVCYIHTNFIIIQKKSREERRSLQ